MLKSAHSTPNSSLLTQHTYPCITVLILVWRTMNQLLGMYTHICSYVVVFICFTVWGALCAFFLRVITCQRALTSLLMHTPHAMNHANTITWEQIWMCITRSWMIFAVIWWLCKLHTTRVEQTFSIAGTDNVARVCLCVPGVLCICISLRLGTSTPGQRLMQGN